MSVVVNSLPISEIKVNGLTVIEVRNGTTLIYSSGPQPNVDVTDYTYTLTDDDLLLSKYTGTNSDIIVPNV